MLLIFAGVVVYLCALLWLIPAGWLWQQVSGQVRLPPQVKVVSVSGSWWDGVAGLRFQGRDLRFEWALSWPSVADLELPVSFGVQTASSRLNGHLVLGWPDEAALQAAGRIHVPEFEDLIRQSNGALLEGDVVIDRLQLKWAENQLAEATGRGHWPGGRVTWPVGDGVQSAQFPAMSASLEQLSDGVTLTVAQQGQPDPAAEADILRNGMLEVRVYKRLIDLAGQPWSGTASPGDVVFRVQQPLIPGARF
ncbi:type II secretion system protein N [Marinobacter sp. SS21]|uniref:type II secretion system protein N n=1 Tax=Marinobacter sp. SS21 TaxID=2979460 RepID=UPI00232DC58A|nr:type II secretion system protein N [Marinobacter sp. SS21]MDC0663848.1 type II secretion system protein N [Marinobacter sp. SS21]